MCNKLMKANEHSEDRSEVSGREPHSGSNDFIQDTLAFWQPKSSRKLTEEDAREIAHNSAAFMRILLSGIRLI